MFCVLPSFSWKLQDPKSPSGSKKPELPSRPINYTIGRGKGARCKVGVRAGRPRLNPKSSNIK